MKSNLLPLFVLSFLSTGCSLDGEYFDARKTSSYSLNFETATTTVEEVSFESNGRTIYGVLATAPTALEADSTSVPTILYFHGDDKDIDKYVSRLDTLLGLGVNVFIFDFQGYGKSEGSSSLSAIKQNSADALTYLKTRNDKIDPDQIIYYGFSVGGIFALYTATQVEMPIGMITESIPASGDQSVRQNLKLGIPSSFMFDESFDNIPALKSITSPILMFHGTDDETISYNDHARFTFNAPIENLRTTIPVEGAGHSTVITTLGEAVYLQDILEFFAANGI
ncbi:MAG: hypothetical protein COV44_06625 [Deltaproteobacteria bacterium CG11_big_fil_rev_8_21_14_0_20_45_16]|nr:MAG: hypothetical protein COV44_06625 [Deltaproteobacteria bacterium CG11_big_fil_rev_8_21_14_0_20_45_16]